MAIFDFFKRGYQSKAELRTINSNLEKRNAGLVKEINGLRETITQKNNRIVKLEGELKEARIELNNLRDGERPQPKRRRYSHRGANGKFAKVEDKQ